LNGYQNKSTVMNSNSKKVSRTPISKNSIKLDKNNTLNMETRVINIEVKSPNVKKIYFIKNLPYFSND
jgi:hypothetical protein